MTDVTYIASATRVTEHDLEPFFAGWTNPPTGRRRVDIVQSADEVVVARNADGTLVGFITALTDGVFAAYIPLLEVVPEAQRRGIGGELVRRMLHRLRECYMIDLACDDDVVPFYDELGGIRLNAIAWRNHDRLGGAGGSPDSAGPDHLERPPE